MGINLCVENISGEDHPEWDFIRYAGDRDFACMIGDLPSTRTTGAYDDGLIRPSDFAAWRAAVRDAKPWPNPGRIEGLLDLLERDSDYWIRVSY